ncbi:MAG: copper resistance CopC family protein [Microbacteriaceae bacterium]
MRNRTLVTVLTAAPAGILLAFTAPLAASAHDYLVSSNPADGSTQTTLPESFSVTSSANLLDLAGDGSASGILVTDSAGLYYGNGCPNVDGPTLSTPASLGEAGEYSFTWQVVSSDGHPTSGQLSFTWAPEDGVELSAGSPTQPVCGETEITPLVTQETMEPTPESEETLVAISASENDVAQNPAAPWVIGGGVISILIGISGMVWLWRTKQGPFRNRG